MADLIEPFIVKWLQKKNHTFFVYRCSDYNNIHHLAGCHRFDLSMLYRFIPLLEKYWTAIDIIMLVPKDMPHYRPEKKYFNTLRRMMVDRKEAVDIFIFEVKLTTKTRRPVLSVRTHELIGHMKKLGKDMEIVEVQVDGSIRFNISVKNSENADYKIRTHYGRKHYSVSVDRSDFDLGSE